LRVALTGLTVAEFFRDEEGADTLLFIDNIFRFTQAGSEVSALLGACPAPWDTSRTWPRNGRIAGTNHLNEKRLGHFGAGYLRPCRRPHGSRAGNDLCPPRRTNGFSRALTRSEFNPAVDPLASTRAFSIPHRRQDHYDVAQGVKKTLQTYKDLQTLSPFSVLTS